MLAVLNSVPTLDKGLKIVRNGCYHDKLALGMQTWMEWVPYLQKSQMDRDPSPTADQRAFAGHGDWMRTKVHRRSWHTPRYAPQDHLGQSVGETDSLSPTQGCRSLLYRCVTEQEASAPIQAGEEAGELTWYWMWSGQGPLEPAQQLRLSGLSQLPGGTKSNPWKILGFQIKKANHVEQARSLQQTANWLVSVKNIEPVGIRKHWPEAHLLGFWGNLLRVHCTFHSHPPPTPPPWTHSFFLLGRNLSSVEGEVAEESQNLVSPLAKLQICPVSPVRLVFTWETLFSELCVLGVKDKRLDKSHSTLSSQSQFSSVAKSCLTLCDPMDCSMPGIPVHHQLPEFTQTHVHWVSDAIQPSHPLSSPSAFNLSQHQGLFK